MDFYTVAIIQGFGYAAMALGIYISLRIFNIPDITTDGSYTLGGAVTAVCILAGMHPLLIIIPAMFSGVLAGIVTGLIHTRFRVNALLAGILVMTALYSVNLGIMERSNIPLINTMTIFNFMGEVSVSGMLMTVAIFIALVAAILIWMLKTDLGISMRATGNSEQMVRAAGVNTNRMKIAGLALANGLTALSGYLLVQYQGYADINMGIGIVISGLAAVMVGEALGKILKVNSILLQVIFVIAGSILFRLILAFNLTLGLHPDYLKLTTAIIVLAVLAMSGYKNSRT